ncbi:hypothetical protein GCM10007981_11570 [Thermocladium modestius]|uniref:Amino acid permease/ SLC12A domain-containing protein n=1 Tax=Thermocladium modestius TaxID=62609 RepID=A0A830GWJ8_9CREN|nr:APC family permease [Thermocladium modestius]GGP21106.1 hypothetical protein GCM10007981_11570 [Thermocladium modestius]
MANKLRENSTGFLGLLYNSLAGQAPTYSIAGGAALIMSTAYAAAPLAMLLTTLGVMTMVYSIYVLSKRYPHAASFYAYPTNSLNSFTGFLNGIIYIIYSLIGLSSVAIAFSYLTTEAIYAVTGSLINPLPLVLVPIVAAMLISIIGIKPSIRTETLLSSIEIIILALFISLSFYGERSRLSLFPFTPEATYGGSINGILAGIGGGLLFSVTYFMGFETSTQISEEAKRPGETVPRATLIATLLMGLLYMATTYAILLNVGFDQTSISNFVSAAEGFGVNPVFTLVEKYLGPWGLVIFSASVIISVFGCYLATLNATARMLFGMSRDGLLPRWLNSIHPKYLSPVTATYVSTIIAAALLVPSYVAAMIAGYSGTIQLTYGAMEYAYAVDSLYYVLSLAVVAIAAFKIVGIYGKAITMGGAALMMVTFYESAQYLPMDYLVLSSIATIMLVEAFLLRGKLKGIKTSLYVGYNVNQSKQ